jgi:hypothetical protein
MATDKKQQYLLDTNVLIRRPRLLARSDAAERFLIPVAAIDQLSSRGNGTNAGPLQRVLSAASRSGVELIDSPQILSPQLPTSPDFRLDAYDLAILGTLQALQSDATRKVSLVTEDRALLKAAIQIGLEAISLDELQQSLDVIQTKAETPINLEVEQQVQKYDKYERSNIQKAIAIGIVAISIAVAVRYQYQQIFSLFTSTPKLFIGLVAVLCGTLLFWFRQRYRASYGMVETLIGAWISVNVFPLTSTLDVASGLQVLGGLYVVVRGLDNVGNGLKGTRYEPNWRRIFG